MLLCCKQIAKKNMKNMLWPAYGISDNNIDLNKDA